MSAITAPTAALPLDAEGILALAARSMFHLFSSIDGHTSKLKGMSPIPLGGLMGYNFAENVWLEA